jgi:hypothetical protein
LRRLPAAAAAVCVCPARCRSARPPAGPRNPMHLGGPCTPAPCMESRSLRARNRDKSGAIFCAGSRLEGRPYVCVRPDAACRRSAKSPANKACPPSIRPPPPHCCSRCPRACTLYVMKRLLGREPAWKGAAAGRGCPCTARKAPHDPPRPNLHPPPATPTRAYHNSRPPSVVPNNTERVGKLAPGMHSAVVQRQGRVPRRPTPRSRPRRQCWHHPLHPRYQPTRPPPERAAAHSGACVWAVAGCVEGGGRTARLITTVAAPACRHHPLLGNPSTFTPPAAHPPPLPPHPCKHVSRAFKNRWPRGKAVRHEEVTAH